MFVFEALMDIMLDFAMIVLIANLLSKKMHGSITEKIVSASMGIGFFMYSISKALNNSNYMFFMLGALGFMLSYAALLFTFAKE